MRLLLIAAVALLAVAITLNVVNSEWYRERQLASKSLPDLGQHVASRPGDFRGHYHLGVKLEAVNRVPDALTHYAFAVRARPEDPRSWRRMGALLLKTGQLPEAEALLTKAIERWPNDRGMRRSLAQTYAALAQWTTAVEHQLRVVDLAPAAGPAPADLVSLGNYQFRAGDRTAAEKSVRRAIQIRADAPGAQKGLGATLLLQGRESEAQAPLEAAVRQFPQDHEAHLYLGRALCASDDPTQRERGRQSIREAIRLHPRFFEAFHYLGEGYQREGLWRESAETLEAAVRWNPYYGAAHGALATTYAKLGRAAEAQQAKLRHRGLETAERQVRDLEARLTASPADADVALKLGELSRRLGRRDPALRYYARALANRPNDRAAIRAIEEMTAETSDGQAP